ncbi:acyl carrier protein [Neobacillus niacini]|uniref:acyl carrier protein n=1 Tax=Neobacillus niacini TaxID=86668 RepID=UPI00285FC09C|nr:acyl carrier protein [Neobacillus niacini]MDR7079700.1 acyl carrier protein [Neobacillus niacini]
MRNIEKYRNAFINVLDLEEDDVCEELALGETREWDSIGHMTLITEIEEVFDVSIDFDWITEFNSYKSGIELLKRLGVDFINE